MFNAPFTDRDAAGEQLGDALETCHGENPVVIGLPRGGVPVAKHVADKLNGELTVFVSKKIPAPHNPEFAIGAATHTGVVTWNQDVLNRLHVSASYTEDAKREALREAREKFNRLGGENVDVNGRVVILVDDGIATGATMRTAVAAVKEDEPVRLVVAVPIAPATARDAFEDVVDEYVCLEEPSMFQAVGQGFKDFTPVTDEECRVILQQYGNTESRG
jgi:predicted phosphoribosyltransferase